jgi:hypothetical protein
MKRVISFIIASRLLFQLVKHPQFHTFIKIAWLALFFPKIPLAYMVRRYLQELVQEW